MGDVKLYLVGGAVREIVRGFPNKVKDWDFAVEAESYEAMRDWMIENDFEIFLETPQYFTIRARAPKNEWSFAGFDMTGRTFDFALCRTDGEYSDGRRPDVVEVGTIKTDLSRRDFTMNAIAMDSDGALLDPYDGQKDISNSIIRCVGGTERLREDSLRMLRALRFSVQLDFLVDWEIDEFMHSITNACLLDNVSVERVRDELHKCFKISSRRSLYMLASYPALTSVIFEKEDLWLVPTIRPIPKLKTAS